MQVPVVSEIMEGCKRGMGQDSRPNRALSSDLMHELLSSVERKAVDATTVEERHRWVMVGAYFVSLMYCHFEGEKAF